MRATCLLPSCTGGTARQRRSIRHTVAITRGAASAGVDAASHIDKANGSLRRLVGTQRRRVAVRPGPQLGAHGLGDATVPSRRLGALREAQMGRCKQGARE